VPSISSLDDTSHFDEVDKPKPPPNIDSFQPGTKDFSGRHLLFVGFTFSRCTDGSKKLVDNFAQYSQICLFSGYPGNKKLVAV
jgi:hypothetical protein